MGQTKESPVEIFKFDHRRAAIIELIIVCCIILILSAIVVPVFIKEKNKKAQGIYKICWEENTAIAEEKLKCVYSDNIVIEKLWYIDKQTGNKVLKTGTITVQERR